MSTDVPRPYDGAHSIADRIEAAIRTASRAPSAHNTQPWLPAITAGGVEVRIDSARTLPVADPEHRDLLLAIGCWVECFSIACADLGLCASDVAVSGDGPATIVDIAVDDADAVTSAGSSGLSTPFSGADVRSRSVHRGELTTDLPALESALGLWYESEPANGAAQEPAAGTVDDGRGLGLRCAAVSALTWARAEAEGSSLFLESEEMLAETLSWLRLDDRDPAYRRDGLTAAAMGFPLRWSRILARVLRSRLSRWAVAKASTWHRFSASIDRQQLERVEEQLGSPKTARAFEESQPHRLVFGAARMPAHSDEWIAAGRSLMRLWLALHRFGLAVSVHSELKDAPAAAAHLRAEIGGEPLAVFFAGRPAKPPVRSPRLTDA